MTCARCARDIEQDSAFCRHCGARVSDPPPRRQRLSRLSDQGQIAGVCAGLAAYFNMDPVLVRLAWVILSIVPGAIVGGILAYGVAWVLLPAESGAGVQTFAGRRLVRSAGNRKIAGVCGGLAEYLGVDATIVRLAWVVLSIYPGAVICGVLAYLVAWIVIPPEPESALYPSPSAP